MDNGVEERLKQDRKFARALRAAVPKRNVSTEDSVLLPNLTCTGVSETQALLEGQKSRVRAVETIKFGSRVRAVEMD